MDKKSNIKSKIEVKINPNKIEQKIVFPEFEELTEDELKLKEELLSLESKIDSIYNVIENINQEKCTIFCDEVIIDTVEILASACITNILNNFLKDGLKDN